MQRHQDSGLMIAVRTSTDHTVNYDPLIKRQLASRNSLEGLARCKFGHVPPLNLVGQRNPRTPPRGVVTSLVHFPLHLHLLLCLSLSHTHTNTHTHIISALLSCALTLSMRAP